MARQRLEELLGAAVAEPRDDQEPRRQGQHDGDRQGRSEGRDERRRQAKKDAGVVGRIKAKFRRNKD